MNPINSPAFPSLRLVGLASFWFLLLCTVVACSSDLQNRHAFEELRQQNVQHMAAYNVKWEEPGTGYYDSMPLGNGDIGLNVWTEPNGELCFYIGKTDSWGPNGILKKVGKVCVIVDPAPDPQAFSFTQELDLLTATYHVRTAVDAGDGIVWPLVLQIRVDAHHPLIHLEYESEGPVKLTARIEPWRTVPNELNELQFSDLQFDPDNGFSSLQPVIIQPDILLETTEDYVGWYHHNTHSGEFEKNLQIQGLAEFVDIDPLLHRTFGALITSEQGRRLDPSTLVTGSGTSGRIEVTLLTSHPSDPETWHASIYDLVHEITRIPHSERTQAHNRWWEDFWNRSWIHVFPAGHSQPLPGDETYMISQAYALQRFITAAAGNGAHPIKFNGSIFTVPAEGEQADADYRRWGPGYWWMNTRLPYYAMPAAGDYELMKPLFHMYAGEVFELSKKRTQKYFDIDGVFYPECVYFWGAGFTVDYGLVPFDEREEPLQESRWHKWAWGSGPELVFIMLDYFDYTGEEEFLSDSIIPVANSVLRFFDQYYETGSDGEWVMHPSQALETWWDTTNPMPEVAGLRSIVTRLLQLPESITGPDHREFWKQMQERIPPIPFRKTPSGRALAPAEQFNMKNNIENPELYAVFPYRLYGTGLPDIDAGIYALEHRWDRGYTGWRQDDLFMSYLGLTDQVKEQIIARAGVHDRRFRFPAFWGPNYDWTPDQTHGAVLMRTLQSMLVQADPYSGEVHLLPAWPGEWDAEFSLHAPYQQRISGRVHNGDVEQHLTRRGSARQPHTP